MGDSFRPSDVIVVRPDSDLVTSLVPGWDGWRSTRPVDTDTRRPIYTAGMCHPGRTAISATWAGVWLLSAVTATAQVVTPPASSGRQLQAGDGDTVIVDGDDRVSLIRRRQAHVRVVADESARTVLVIADWGTGASAAPDGRVNRIWRFAGIDGRWPLESRWEGVVALMVPEMPPMSVGPSLTLDTPAGVVAFVGGPQRSGAADAAVVLRYESLSGGGREGTTFDEAERDAMSSNFMTSFSTMSFGSGGGWVAASGTETAATFERSVPPPRGGVPGTRGPILSAMPRIVERVQPEWPQEARDAGAQGMVILQADVATDGTVRDARVVRGQPLLTAAAVEAVRRWRFEPAGPDGRPDPMTVTVTVQFPPLP